MCQMRVTVMHSERRTDRPDEISVCFAADLQRRLKDLHISVETVEQDFS